MNTTTFGKTGLQVSPLGFGAAPIGYLDTQQERIEKVLKFLLDSGVNLIDTAASYPGSEEAIGKAISDRRDEFILVTKCGQSFPDLKGEAWSGQVVRETVDRALKRLRTDHLDVMLLHSCGLDVLKKGEALGALVEARQAGKIRFAGYSGDNEAVAYAAAELEEVAVIETSINIVDQANITGVLPICQRNNLGVIAKRPIANAAWKDRDAQPGMYKKYSADYAARLAAMNITPLELGYSGHPEVEWPEIALQFTLAQPGVHTAIVGTTSLTNARINVEAVQKDSLRDEAIRKLRDAFKAAEKASGEAWPALT